MFEAQKWSLASRGHDPRGHVATSATSEDPSMPARQQRGGKTLLCFSVWGRSTDLPSLEAVGYTTRQFLRQHHTRAHGRAVAAL